MPNQNPEQIARDNIDNQLIDCGWVIQSLIESKQKSVWLL